MPDQQRDHTQKAGSRETFASRFGLLMTMIGVAVGLGNVWRFPYMAGKFGGAPFVLFYVMLVIFLGVPALVAEWTLGRATRRGPVGAFARAGFPAGRFTGWFFFCVVIAATGYYTNALGWVFYHALSEALRLAGVSIAAAAILPPASGFVLQSFLLQIACSGLILLLCAAILHRGLRTGIEAISKIIMPGLLVILLILIVRTLTLPNAGAGVHWFILKFEFAALKPGVMLAALGQAVFTLSLGGTFMVVYGSYLPRESPLVRNAIWTAAGDTAAGLLAGLAIIPAVFAFGLQPSSGPGLLFATLPKVFAALPLGGLFGALFFAGLFGAAFLSDIAALEVLVTGVADNTKLGRRRAVWLVVALVFIAALPPMLNMEIFVPWDLTFGSGMQTLGALVAVITVAWFMKRARILQEICRGKQDRRDKLLYVWMKYVIPAAMLSVGIWWFLTEILGFAAAP